VIDSHADLLDLILLMGLNTQMLSLWNPKEENLQNKIESVILPWEIINYNLDLYEV